ncbi:MAG: urate hydroxylase PuuD [Planctomycetota bacterium]
MTASALVLAPAVQPLDLVELAFRFGHFAAGVLWIGLLWFLSWIHAPFVASLAPEARRAVVPAFAPRVFFWLRWAALLSWLSGTALLFLVYYAPSSGYLMARGAEPDAARWMPAFFGMAAGFFVYDALCRLPRGLAVVSGLAWGACVVGFAWALHGLAGFSARGTYAHVAALLGTVMAGNVWMRIWPAQERMLAALADGAPPDLDELERAGQRARHGTLMSFAVLLLMIGVGQVGLFRFDVVPTVAGVLALSYGLALALFATAPRVGG